MGGEVGEGDKETDRCDTDEVNNGPLNTFWLDTVCVSEWWTTCLLIESFFTEKLPENLGGKDYSVLKQRIF